MWLRPISYSKAPGLPKSPARTTSFIRSPRPHLMMGSAIRVILRVREADFEEDDMFKPVRLYLEKMGRSVCEIEEHRHYIHFQLSNAHIPQRDPKIHIIIDLNYEQFSGDVVDKDFSHEIYAVGRVDNKL